ncbi:polysaccharide biosynthesis tyrosine autokinase [Anaeromyxobacter diazotrophicus]|uniref:Tyrosine kinase BceF n=1 Tax=Anaeromyxobacter diazotrophicus TaxID=2590199 RepID=A0A7I9VP29_9BACT|nr:polysaccharide biosynthesis tyrosine autokinase [Anaeromyxobacter diazotrophicus]GEJ58162.1 tyrosine kinase BceF [Anaeromyxobacter diazotrophicus]
MGQEEASERQEAPPEEHQVAPEPGPATPRRELPSAAAGLTLREDELTARELGRALAARWRTLLASTLGALAAAALYLGAAPPVHRATMSLQVSDPQSLGVRLRLAQPAFEPPRTTEGHAEILRSRSVLGPVVDALGLDVVAEPSRFPIFGGAAARARQAPVAPPLDLPRLARWAWGGERIAVARLDVPEDLAGERLTLTAEGADAFRLALPSGRVLLAGRVGEPARAAYGAGRLELLVSELAARPGTEFHLEKLRREDAIAALRDGLWIEETVKGAGVMSVWLDGPDPARLAAVLAELARSYLRQDAERRAAETAARRALLDARLPEAAARVDEAEAALVRYRTSRGIVDLPLQAKAAVDRSAELEALTSDLASEQRLLSTRYTDQHPDAAALERRLTAAREERAALDPRVRALPDDQRGAAGLARSASVATRLDGLLSAQAQRMSLAQAWTLGEARARLLDAPAVSAAPVRPAAPATWLLALFLGLGGGGALILARRAGDAAASDPLALERATGLQVMAAVPHSRREATLGRRRRARRVPLAADSPDDPSIESLRGLRTALGCALESRGRVVAVSSPSAGAGKSFLCANLAQLAAAAGMRVLLVDADLRRGTVHRSFAAETQPGLADVLTGAATVEQATRSTGTPGLELMARGTAAALPAELLSSPRMQELCASAARRYDLVLLDAPPVLEIPDPVLVARCASLNLLVVRVGRRPASELALALERYAHVGAAVHGAILNDTKAPAIACARSPDSGGGGPAARAAGR